MKELSPQPRQLEIGDFRNICAERIAKVRLRPMPNEGLLLRDQKLDRFGRPMFLVLIDSGLKPIERHRTFLHEVIHISFEAFTLAGKIRGNHNDESYDKEEDEIEKETLRFYKAHKKLVKTAYERLLGRTDIL